MFGRRAGVGVRGKAMVHTRKLVVKPLKRAKRSCPEIRGEVTHYRLEQRATVRFRCGRRRWTIELQHEPDIETALASAKAAARHWRSLLQSGEELPPDPHWPL
ncbi:MAG: hypothetical protein JJ863_38600 [Deltaproteobacteria bacterium]|nr:hypothetical protein [Deltaproteobacteria bacterium]